MHKHKHLPGFTIVELLVVIVVIGILATITVVSYTGISNKAIIASIQSDLGSSFKRLKLFQVENSGYPTSITDCPTPAAGNLCVKPSGSNTIANYVKDNTISPQGFCINITNGTNSYKITSTTYPTPTTGDCDVPPPVTVNYSTPGSSTWTIPSSVTSLQLAVWGAKGSAGYLCGWSGVGAGSNGGYAAGTLSVSGSSLYINVGSSTGGGSGGPSSGDCFDGTGSGGNGGGASDVRYGGNALSDRKIVAGGGGGGSGGLVSSSDSNQNGSPGGVGGGTAGTNGGGSGGTAGTQSSGYALGVGGPGVGGDSGGGGGSGYYGGSGGTYYSGGGGGGSGYVGGVTSTTLTAGNASMPAPGGGTETGHAGTGYVRIIYTPGVEY